jgi:hypothetical protein
MSTPKAKSWANYVALQAALGTATYFGGFREVPWAGWLVVGLVWFTLLIYLFVLIDPETRAEARSRVRSVPRWIAWPLDVAFVAAFLAAHWYVTAVAYVALSIVYWGILPPRPSSTR